MENLEQTLRKVESGKEVLTPLAGKPLYQGLKLIEDKVYARGTSIRYWM